MPIFNKKPTDLDLNGPVLSFTTNPTGVSSTGVGVNSTGGGSVSLTGIATYSFQGNESVDQDGTISYQWYEGSTPVENGTYITGAATTTLTLTNLITPTDNDRKFYLQADFVPGYTGPSTTYLTGNALNEPLNSGVGTVSVDPLIEIISQPSNVQALIGSEANITITADLTDDAYIGAGLTYQWTLNGEVVTDGTVTTTTTTNSTTSGTVENTYTTTTNNVSVPSTATNIEVVLAGAQGGNGGNDGNGPGGTGAQGRAGRFSLPSGAKDLDFYIGNTGNGGGTGNQDTGGTGGVVHSDGDGGKGGGAGQSGWSGGGGGGGAASYLTNDGSTIIVSAGGGGGGGGSHNRAGDSGFDRNPGVGLGYGTGSVGSLSNGSGGTTKNGDGGGGGGGGGGAPGGSGGGAGQDNSHGGEAGSGGSSAMDPAQVTLQGSGWLNEGEGYGYLTYTSTTSTEITTTRNTVVSGATSKTLTLESDIVGVQTAQCTVYHPDASNSPVVSDTVNFVTVSTTDQNMVMVESIGTTDTASVASINLNNGEYTFEVEGTDVDNNGINQFYSFYSPDKDLDIEMDLYGGKGANYWGGEGGFSRIRFTLEQNQEYVLAGLISSINAPFLYRKGTLIAVVGEGGAGVVGDPGYGGLGGGVNVAGENSWGREGGNAGGEVIPEGGLTLNGIFGSSFVAPTLYPGDTQAPDTWATLATSGDDNGGRTIRCTKGVYYAQQGVGACADIAGTVKFRLSDGTVVTNTEAIVRGFKAGYNIMQTAGKPNTKGGRGGNGATGGTGGGAGRGGGGGSGYTDGSVTVVSTRLGGSTGDAKVILRLAV